MAHDTNKKSAKCPRCEGVLKFGSYEGQDVHHCSSCSGTLFSLASLGQALDSLSFELFSTVNPDVVLPALPDSGDELTCPLCSCRMENYGYMGTHKVMLDACNNCNRVWVDALELATMARMQVRLDSNMRQFRNSHQPSDIVGLAMTIRAVEAAFLGGFILG